MTTSLWLIPAFEMHVFQPTSASRPKIINRCRGETLSLERRTGECSLKTKRDSGWSLNAPSSGTVQFFLLFFVHYSTFLRSRQDGPRGGDVRDIKGPAVRLQGRHLVAGGHPDRDGAGRAAQPRDEPNESPAENRQGRPSNADAAVPLVSRSTAPAVLKGGRRRSWIFIYLFFV